MLPGRTADGRGEKKMVLLNDFLQAQTAVTDMDLFWPIFATTWTATALFGLVLYVFESLGVYTIAKRRQIRRPWLSWIPIANLWILGSISDQYQYVVKGRVRNRRKVLLATGIITTLLSVAVFVAGIVVMVESLVAANEGYLNEMWLVNMALTLGVLSLVLSGFGVWYAVYNYIACHDIYASCDPDTKTVFLVLSIVFSFLMPIFLFADRKKDNGMPPRTDEMYMPAAQSEQ